jgi:hypothetical protein
MKRSLDLGRLEHVGLDGDFEARGSLRQVSLDTVSRSGFLSLGLGAWLSPTSLCSSDSLGLDSSRLSLELDGRQSTTIILVITPSQKRVRRTRE